MQTKKATKQENMPAQQIPNNITHTVALVQLTGLCDSSRHNKAKAAPGDSTQTQHARINGKGVLFC